MAPLEPRASGVYIPHWLQQNDKNQHRQVCLVKMHLSSGLTSMSVFIQVNPLSAPPCPTHETKALAHVCAFQEVSLSNAHHENRKTLTMKFLTPLK